MKDGKQYSHSAAMCSSKCIDEDVVDKFDFYGDDVREQALFRAILRGVAGDEAPFFYTSKFIELPRDYPGDERSVTSLYYLFKVKPGKVLRLYYDEFYY